MIQRFFFALLLFSRPNLFDRVADTNFSARFNTIVDHLSVSGLEHMQWNNCARKRDQIRDREECDLLDVGLFCGGRLW